MSLSVYRLFHRQQSTGTHKKDAALIEAIGLDPGQQAD